MVEGRATGGARRGAAPDVAGAHKREPRLAEKVADVLRERIASGSLAAGESLPKQEALLAELGVSRPTLRDALGILETEGFVTVRRGSQGGAVVHGRGPVDLVRSLALVLDAQRVPFDDVVAALSVLEPACAALCATRPDRKAAVPALRAACDDAADAIDDAQRFAAAMRRFHELVADACDNTTMHTLVGSLQRLWPATGGNWAFTVTGNGTQPSREMRESMLYSHQRIVDLIEAGDVDNVTRLFQHHLCVSHIEPDGA